MKDSSEVVCRCLWLSLVVSVVVSVIVWFLSLAMSWGVFSCDRACVYVSLFTVVSVTVCGCVCVSGL